MEENIQQVNEAQNMGEGAEKVKDRGSKQEQKHNSGGKNKESKEEKNAEEAQVNVLRDPYLGRKIDISL